MTDTEKLAALRAMVGDSDTDEVLSTYLKLSGSKILAKAYPYDDAVTEIPIKYEYLQIEIAAYPRQSQDWRCAQGRTGYR